MRNISITLDGDGRVSTETQLLGYSGEHNAVTITVSFTEVGYTIYSQSEYFRLVLDGCYSDELYMTGNAIVYTVPQECMRPPVVHGQLIGYKNADGEVSAIIKSEVFSFDIDRSEVPFKVVDVQPDIFERTLSKCSKAAAEAKVSAETAKQAEETVVSAAETIADDLKKSERAAESAESAAANAAKSAAVLSQTVIDFNNISNSLKCRASGSVVTLGDVSPLEHDVSVKLTGDFAVPETVTAQFSDTVKELRFTSPTKNAAVSIEGGAYTVGAVVPVIYGVDFSAVLSDVAVPVQYAYSEAGTVMELNYSVSGSVISWSGYKNWISGDESSKTAVSGSYDTGVPGIAISGFYQPYSLDENNPYYLTPEYDCLDISVTASTEAAAHTTVVLSGKNLVNIPDFTAVGDGTVKRLMTLENRIKCHGQKTCLSCVVTHDGSIKANATGNIIYANTTFEDGAVLNYGIFVNNDGSFEASSPVLDSDTHGDITKIIIFTHSRWTGGTAVISKIQLETGSTVTDYEPYVEPSRYTPDSDGHLTVRSIYPTMILSVDSSDVTMDVEYNRDINKAIAEIKTAIDKILSVANSQIIDNVDENKQYASRLQIVNGKPVIKYDEV